VIDRWIKTPEPFSKPSLMQLRASTNSYFGLMRHASTYRFRQRLSLRVQSLFVSPDLKFEKLVLAGGKKR